VNTTKQLTAGITVREAGAEPSVTITTSAQDLMNDTIDMAGMDVSSYLNGTRAVNFAHDHSRLPVGKTVALERSAQGIRATFTWLDLPDAHLVRTAFDAGVLGASIEFRPMAYEPNADGGYHFSKTVLTGWALTANPANPQCVRMLKSLGARALDLDRDILVLDDEPVDLSGISAAAVRAALLPELDIELSDDDVRQALAEAIPAMVSEHVRSAVNRARGRLD
jgi:hypothetical protein